MKKVSIALDAMGGDHGPQVVVPAALNALAAHPFLRLILVGDEATILPHLSSEYANRIEIIHTDESVAMNELPSVALRTKKQSSMRLAINLVKEKTAEACVSAGNTGALMATARFVLKTLPCIDRPAIISELPAMKGPTRVLDLGANVDSCAEHLCQFAVMGSVLTTVVNGIERPTVGLLNIGSEEIKGNDQVKHTAHLLSKMPAINYIGYVEGDDILRGAANVIVCDGFVGNIALKTIEGVAHLLKHHLTTAFHQNWYNRLSGFLALPALSHVKNQMNPSRYNGASLLGLQGSVIKSHGSADIFGYTHAIGQAVMEAKSNVPALIYDKVGEILEDGNFT